MIACPCGTTTKVNTLCCDGVHRCEGCWRLHRQSGGCREYAAFVGRSMWYTHIGRIQHGVLEFVALGAWSQP